MPRHVSFIMDGNGRWAEKQGKERLCGHQEGAESVRAVMMASVKWGIEYASFYAFSEENWGRPESEVNGLMDLMGRLMIAEEKTFMDNGIRFRVLGNRSRLSAELLAGIEKLEAVTADNSRMTMILFMSYSGRWDIFQAAKAMAHDLIESPGFSPRMEDFDKYLVTADIPDPDLIVRTSGEQRISNYMLWQAAYTEFVFTDVYWPDFREPQYKAALEEFAHRDRRFGKVKK